MIEDCCKAVSIQLMEYTFLKSSLNQTLFGVESNLTMVKHIQYFLFASFAICIRDEMTSMLLKWHKIVYR